MRCYLFHAFRYILLFQSSQGQAVQKYCPACQTQKSGICFHIPLSAFLSLSLSAHFHITMSRINGNHLFFPDFHAPGNFSRLSCQKEKTNQKQACHNQLHRIFFQDTDTPFLLFLLVYVSDFLQIRSSLLNLCLFIFYNFLFQPFHNSFFQS